jgi:hypothetical protein
LAITTSPLCGCTESQMLRNWTPLARLNQSWKRQGAPVLRISIRPGAPAAVAMPGEIRTTHPGSAGDWRAGGGVGGVAGGRATPA